MPATKAHLFEQIAEVKPVAAEVPSDFWPDEKRSTDRVLNALSKARCDQAPFRPKIRFALVLKSFS